ncbi:uncharacterized protein LOC132639319 [Lycium barbarum]|uniref:uncharacterized protein LOC132639319 n=1 Tax=Lycium barbarum TaxID=112863 RepID=UPI00293F1441|nr:uncharacterized protein LOC132639319 [Lycium barbarum]
MVENTPTSENSNIAATTEKHMLLLSPSPSVNHSYSLLIGYEKQREVQLSQHHHETAFLAGKTQYNGNSLTGKTQYNGHKSNFEVGQSSGQKFNSDKKGFSDPRKGYHVCSYCEKTGHTVENKRFTSNAKGSAAMMTNKENGNQSAHAGEKPMTQDQFHSFYQLLQYVKIISVYHSGSIDLMSNFTLRNAPSLKRLAVLGRAKGGLYLLHTVKPKVAGATNNNRIPSVSVCNMVASNPVSNSILFLGVVASNVHVSHSRIGHLPFSNMKNIPAIPLSSIKSDCFTCDICAKSRQAKLTFPSSSIPSTHIFDIIHVDT